MGTTKRSLPVRILLVLGWTIVGLFLTYAVAFSIVATVAIVVVHKRVMEPVEQVKALAKSNPAQTAYMRQYRENLSADSQPDTLVQVFVPLDSISDFLKKAVIAAEDDGFYTHPGFDIEAMLSAIDYNRSHGSLKRGASTITQQLAKNFFLSTEKSFQRKYMELAYTLLMEKYLGKDRILELYLNYAQWGKNLFGCEAAAQHYYKKSSRNLSRGEAARMAAVLAMPGKITPHSTRSTFLGKRIAVIANNLYLHGSIDDSGYAGLTGYPPPRPDSTDTAGGLGLENDLSPSGWR